MDNVDLMKHWITSAERDLISVDVLADKSQNTHALFFGHLVLEKLLKGIYAKQNKNAPHAPKTHNLLMLAQKCNLNMNQLTMQRLGVINQFCLEARYEDYKNDFYKICTKEFTAEQINIIKELATWLKSESTKA